MGAIVTFEMVGNDITFGLEEYAVFKGTLQANIKFFRSDPLLDKDVVSQRLFLGREGVPTYSYIERSHSGPKTGYDRQVDAPTQVGPCPHTDKCADGIPQAVEQTAANAKFDAV